jgi:hypothetical protein
MAEQLNNVQILDESGTLRGLNPTVDYLKITTPFEVGNDVKVGGDLTVNGDIISKGQQNVVIQDPILDLGLGNTTTSATAGGFTVTMNRASGFTAETVTDFTAGVLATSAPSFTVSGGSTAFAAGDLVAITGADDGENDGIYVVFGVAAGVVTIKGTGGTAPSASVPFAQTQFKAASSQNASAYKIDIAAAVFADGTAAFKDPAGGSWPKGTFVTAYASNAVESDFTGNGDYDTAAQTSLQEAYEVGNTITTNGTDGDVVIAGDQKLSVSASGGLQVSGGALDVNTSVDVDLTGSFAVDGAQAATFGATTALSSFAVTATGDIDLSGATLDLAATGALEIDAAAASYIKVTAANLSVEASGAGVLDLKSGTEVQVTTALFDVNASGAAEIASVGNSFFQTTSGDLLIQTITSGELDLTAAGLMDVNAGANLDLDVTGTMDFDSTGAFSIDGSGASNVTAQGNLSVQAQGSGSDLILDAADIIDMNGASLDADLTGAFNVTGGASSKLNTTAAGAGDITIDAEAGKVIIEGGKAAVSDAVKIWATAATGGIQMVAGTGNIDAATTGSVYLGAGQASNFTVSSGDMLLDATSDIDGAIKVYAAGPLVDAVHIHASDAVGGIDIDAGTGGIALDSTGAISLGAGGASDFTVSSGDLTLEATASSVVIEGGEAVADAVYIHASDTAGGVDIDAGTGGIALDTTGALSLDSTGTAANLTLTANAAGTATLTLAASNSGAGVADIDIDADGAVTVDAVGAISLGAGAASDFTVNAGALTLEANDGTTGAVQILGGGALAAAVALQAFDDDGGIDIDAGTGGIAADTTGAISLDAATSSNLTVTGEGASLTLAAAGGGAQQLVASSAGTGTDALRFHAANGGVDMDAVKGIALDAGLSSNLTVTANAAGNQTLTLKATNSGAGQASVVIEGDEQVSLRTTAGPTVVTRVGTNGMLLEVKKDNDLAFQVSNSVVTSAVKHQFNGAAGVELTANASATVVAGTVCAFDSAGKMIAANCAAGGNSPAAQDEVTRYPFAAAVTSVNANGAAMFQSVPGTKIALAFDSAPSAGLVGQAVFLGGGVSNAGKVTLTAPTTSNASIWRVGILASTTADASGNYPVYWHPQYLGRRPVS